MVQRWSAARISEALSLTWADVGGKHVTFKKSQRKRKPQGSSFRLLLLAEELAAYKEHWAKEHGHQPKPSEALFPAAGSTTSTMTRQAADKAFRAACKAVAIEGASLHSFRRTMAQNLVAKGVPLPTVQLATGHKSLSSLGEYLTASQEDVLAAMLA
jgi:integrase/recombinase XerD